MAKLWFSASLAHLSHFYLRKHGVAQSVTADLWELEVVKVRREILEKARNICVCSADFCVLFIILSEAFVI